MSNNTVVISGASGNLGSAVVDYFINKKWEVHGLTHHLSGKTSEGYAELEVDLLDEAASKEAVEKIISKTKAINVAVLTVGGFAMGTIEETSMKEMRRQYELNFVTAYHLARPLLSQIKKQGTGKLFFISSMPGIDTKKGKGITAYSLAKSQLTQLAHIMNAEMKGTDVKAYVIVPSTIDTPQNREAMPEGDYSQWETPEVIASIIGEYAEKKIQDITEIVIQDQLK